jgi:hypothetical protein
MYTDENCSYYKLYIYFSVAKYITNITPGIKLDFHHKSAYRFLLLEISYYRSFLREHIVRGSQYTNFDQYIWQNIRDGLANHTLI